MTQILIALYLIGAGYWSRLAHEALVDGETFPPRKLDHWIENATSLAIILCWPIISLGFLLRLGFAAIASRIGRA